MKGQAKALIPALIGIAILLLTGISGEFFPSGERQATTTANSAAGSAVQKCATPCTSLRSAADKAALQTYSDVAEAMATDLRSPGYLVAQADLDGIAATTTH